MVSVFPDLQAQNNIFFIMTALLVIVAISIVLYSVARAYG